MLVGSPLDVDWDCEATFLELELAEEVVTGIVEGGRQKSSKRSA